MDKKGIRRRSDGFITQCATGNPDYESLNLDPAVYEIVELADNEEAGGVLDDNKVYTPPVKKPAPKWLQYFRQAKDGLVAGDPKQVVLMDATWKICVITGNEDEMRNNPACQDAIIQAFES